MEVQVQSFSSRLDCDPEALTEMTLECMNPGEQKPSQALCSTQDWFTVENTYQAPSGTSSFWFTNDLLVSCNYTDSNLLFASETSFESQSNQLDFSPTAGKMNFTNDIVPSADLHNLTGISNHESPNIVSSSANCLITVSENNAGSFSGTSCQTRQAKKGIAPAQTTSRKRGRPRKDRLSPEALSPITRRHSEGARRIPHNEVEKKYREGLNASFRKLQCAVPELAQLSDPIIGTARPSKAVVIDSAIEYIHRLEKERDKARFLLDNYRNCSSCTSEDACST